MSTGIFRAYPVARLPAPNFTPGQALGSPIGAATMLGAYARSISVTALVPLGIAALIPVSVAFVPPPAMAMVAQAPYVAQQLGAELVAPFVSQVGPSAPPPLTAVPQPPRTVYPVQELWTEIAPLILQQQTYIAPAPLPIVARIQGTALQDLPGPIAPFLSSNTPDYVLPAPIASIARTPAAPIQQPEPEIAAVLPAAAAFVPPTSVARVPGAPQLATVQLRMLTPIVGATFLRYDPVYHPARGPYPTQWLRVWLVQGAAVVPPPDFIDMSRVLSVSFNGRTLRVPDLADRLIASRSRPRSIH
jgi:hypothetical protein